MSFSTIVIVEANEDVIRDMAVGNNHDGDSLAYGKKAMSLCT